MKECWDGRQDFWVLGPGFRVLGCVTGEKNSTCAVSQFSSMANGYNSATRGHCEDKLKKLEERDYKNATYLVFVSTDKFPNLPRLQFLFLYAKEGDLCGPFHS